MLPDGQKSFTRPLIYVGILLISILSFFTTLQGMLIMLNPWLAVVGALGLQLAMLGIAWNLMQVRHNKLSYVLVFSTAAFFSMFFSYANFNSQLKGNTRALDARAAYATAARPMIEERLEPARKASLSGHYQIQRISDLQRMEREKGWSTYIDEGSNDPLVQEVIDGARKTAASWQTHQGFAYRQGQGQGIICDYLQSQLEYATATVGTVDAYIASLEEISRGLHNGVPVKEQYDLVVKTAMTFPIAEVNRILGQTPHLSTAPPSPAFFPETAVNSQHALTLVIGDLREMDGLTFFAVLLAVAIDAIVILMALAGSRAADGFDLPFVLMEKVVDRRTRKLNCDDINAVGRVFAGNLQRYRKVNEYSRGLTRAMLEYKRIKEDYHGQLTKNTTTSRPSVRAVTAKAPPQLRQILHLRRGPEHVGQRTRAARPSRNRNRRTLEKSVV